MGEADGRTPLMRCGGSLRIGISPGYPAPTPVRGTSPHWDDRLVVGVLLGFGVIAAVVAAGWGVGRARVLGEGARYVLARLTFFVFTPSLLFTVLARADIATVFSAPLAIAAASFAVCAAIFMVVARVFWRRSAGETVIGGLAASYVNASNMGIPVSLYVLGDAALSAPIILMQLAVITPILLTVLDRIVLGRVGVLESLTRPFKNPIVIGAIIGLIVALLDLEVPEPVMAPFLMMGAASVPVMLIAFGMSLAEERPLGAGRYRRDIIVATALKLLLMPAIAWVLATAVFGLDRAGTFAVVVLAALPAAQNVFTYAQRYRVAEPIARDSVLFSTVLAVPVVLVIAALLAPR